MLGDGAWCMQLRIFQVLVLPSQELPSIQLPSRPLGITVDEKTNTLYVAMLDRNVNPIVNAIAVVKITGETGDQTQTQIDTIPIFEDPENPDPTRPTQSVDAAINLETNHLYVANLGGGGIAPCVTAINLATRKVTTVKTISGARAIAVNSVLNQIYIGTDSGVQILDGATNTIVSTIPKKVSWGIAFNPTTNQIYAGSATEGTIMQIAAPDLSTITQWT
jgi:DNA-binding beta-propeller fold protein YncE